MQSRGESFLRLDLHILMAPWTAGAQQLQAIFDPEKCDLCRRPRSAIAPQIFSLEVDSLRIARLSVLLKKHMRPKSGVLIDSDPSIGFRLSLSGQVCRGVVL